MAKKSKKSKKQPKQEKRKASEGQLSEEELESVAGGFANDTMVAGGVGTTLNTVSTGITTIEGSTSNVSIGTLSRQVKF